MNPSEAGSWTRGRVTLVGDAASWCPCSRGKAPRWPWWRRIFSRASFTCAQGDYRTRLTDYQDLFGPFVLRKQRAALRFAGAFAPKTKLGLFASRQIMNLMRIPWITDLVVSRDIADKIALPEY